MAAGKAGRLCRCALAAGFIAVCSQLGIPADIPLTMQTFAIFLVTAMLGAKAGSAAIGVYILLGAVGFPVFSGFSGGPGRLFGPTGGYIAGFLFMGPCYGLARRLFGRGGCSRAAGLFFGLIVCYAFGTGWYAMIYAPESGAAAWAAAAAKCAAPYIIPDLIKLALALFVHARLRARAGFAFVG